MQKNTPAFTMKKNKCSFFILAAIGCVAGLSSCNKGLFNNTEKETDFIVNDVPFSIPVLTKTGQSDSITAFHYKVNMDSLVKKLDGKFDTTDLKSALLTNCELFLDNHTAADNFSSLHTCTIGIETAKLPNLTRLSTKTDIVDTPAYYLKMQDQYTQNYNNQYMADSVNYIIYGNIRKITSLPMTGKARLTFHMKLSR